MPRSNNEERNETENAANGMKSGAMTVGAIIKRLLASKLKIVLIIVLIVILVFALLAGSLYYLKNKLSKPDPNDPKNAVSAVKKFMEDTTIDENGNIVLGKTAQEFWDELVKNNNDLLKYLNSPSDIAKLMNAQLATEYVYTGKEQDYNKALKKLVKGENVDSREVQGIIRIKRALSSGGNPIYMTYKSPNEFQKLINKYNESGSEKDRKEALKYFTLERNSNYVSDSGQGVAANVENMQLLTSSGIVTFYNGDGSGIEGGKLNAQGNNLEEGQCAVKEGYVPYNSVIYIETSSSGNASYANGKFFYVTDTGKLSSDQVDVYAPVSQDKLNASPYGKTNSAKIYLVEKDVKYEDYKSNYKGKTVNNIASETTTNTNITPSTGASAVIEKAVSWMSSKVNDKSVPLNQGCMSYLLKAYRNAGANTPGSCTSNTADAILPKYGFVNITNQVDMKTGKGLQKGDIIVKKRSSRPGHSAMYIEGNRYIEYRNSKGVGSRENYPNQYSDGWTQAFRYVGSGNSSTNTATTSSSTVSSTTTATSNDSHWPTKSTYISSPFGYRDAPTAGASTYHEGIDIAGDSGDNIEATEAGKVIDVGSNSAEGNYVELDHGNGVKTTYMHMLSTPPVKKGDIVSRGQVIGQMGSTGISTAEHLHFRVEVNGKAVDPLSYKYDNGKGNGTGGIGSTVQGTNSTQTTNSQNSPYIVKVATFSESSTNTTTIDPNQDVGGGEYTYSMTTQAIDYRNYVSGYTMPFNYLWVMLLVGEDKDFVFDLADLVFYSKFEITIKDNLKTTTTVINNYYKYENNYKLKDATYSVAYTKPDQETGTASMSGYSDSDWTKVYDPANGNYCITTTKVDITNTLDISLTLADAWCAKYEEKFKHKHIAKHITSGPDEESLPDIKGETSTIAGGMANTLAANKTTSVMTDFLNGNVTYTVNNVSVASATAYYKQNTIERSVKTTVYTESDEYTTTPGKVEEKTDEKHGPNFVTVLKGNYNARSNIVSVTSWLFKYLENNDDTKDMIDLTKYLLYKATGRNYGVTEFDFSVFKHEDLTSVGQLGIALLKEYIHYFEQGTTPPPTSADGKKYIIESDGAGHPTVGYGVDIENSGYKQEFVSAGYPTTIGGQVDKEFVDGIEEKILNSMMDEIRKETSGLNLTEYQIYALVSRAYNCGSYGAVGAKRGNQSLNFAQSYRQYWNQQRDDKFEKKDKNADFNHQLYQQYMSVPVTSDGQYMPGLEKRRKSEWTLFQTGYFDVLDKWYSSGGGILAAADAVHNDEKTWTYSVGSDLFWNDIEKSLHNPNKVTCCATYVNCVIYTAGLASESEMNSFGYNGATNTYNHFKSKWKEITSYNQLEAGDIVFMTDGSGDPSIGHVQIYAGNGTWYNAGSTAAIQRASPYESDASGRFIVALRPTA